tara:strand:+ start:1204 stop:1476 length:273 start_codon:yes stop_codon:yes gene_type:complete
MKLDTKLVEGHLRVIIEEVSKGLGLDTTITRNTRPYNEGLTSQILISVMTRLEVALDINIPDNCYIFFEKSTRKQLSITEAANKLVDIID